MEELIAIARFALKEAVRLGAEFADVGVAQGRSLEIEMRESAVVSCDVHEGVVVTVRCFVAGGCGIHVCHGMERADLTHAAAAAVSAARAAGPDPDFRTLPSPAPAGLVDGLWDEELALLDVSGASELARTAIERALSVAGDANVSGALSVVKSEGAFANSLGIEAEEAATSASVELSCVIRRSDQTGSFVEFDLGRRLKDLDIPAVGESAARGALQYMGARKMKAGTMPVVFGPLAASEVVESIAAAAAAEPIQRNRSFLCGKLGRRIAPKILTIEDDGRYPAGMRSSSRDGEGTPRQPLLIVEKGVLVNLLHNSYTAGKAGVRSTGHGTQFGGISPTNLRPRVGTRPAARLIADVDDGLYVDSCQLGPDAVTGDISATVDWAMKIEKGELAYPVTGLAISGNMLELLASLEDISSDYREEPGTVMPTMLFGRMHVTTSS